MKLYRATTFSNDIYEIEVTKKTESFVTYTISGRTTREAVSSIRHAYFDTKEDAIAWLKTNAKGYLKSAIMRADEAKKAVEKLNELYPD